MMKIKPNMLRGKLLSLMNQMYPTPINEMDIVGILYQYHSVDDIKRELQYLADKEYCTRTELPHPYKIGEKIVTCKLTARGLDLLNGDIPTDPGIVVPVEE